MSIEDPDIEFSIPELSVLSSDTPTESDINAAFARLSCWTTYGGWFKAGFRTEFEFAFSELRVDGETIRHAQGIARSEKESHSRIVGHLTDLAVETTAKLMETVTPFWDTVEESQPLFVLDLVGPLPVGLYYWFASYGVSVKFGSIEVPVARFSDQNEATAFALALEMVMDKLTELQNESSLDRDRHPGWDAPQMVEIMNSITRQADEHGPNLTAAVDAVTPVPWRSLSTRYALAGMLASQPVGLEVDTDTLTATARNGYALGRVLLNTVSTEKAPGTPPSLA